MVDIGTLSLILLLAMFALLAIGMPLGFASGFLAVLVMVLKFEPTRARWVSRETWHPQQTGRLEADGSWILEVPYSDPRELVMDILKYGADVEVLEPARQRSDLRHAQQPAAQRDYGAQLQPGAGDLHVRR